MSSDELSLLNMPDVVMGNILVYCDYESYQSMRKTCGDLRSLIDDTKLTPHANAIYITMESDSISLDIYFDNTDQPLKLEYIRRENGCQVERYSRTSNFLKNQNYIEVFLQDFQIFLNYLKNQKTPTDYMKFVVHNKDNGGFCDGFRRILNPLNPSEISEIKISHLCLRVHDESQVFSVLPFISSKFLKKLEIIDSRRTDLDLDLTEIENLEQWKNLENVEIYSFHVRNPKRFSRFLRAKANFMTVTVEEVEFLKRTFLSSPNFQSCKLTFIFMDDIPSIFRALGPDSFIDHDYIGRARRRWFFRSDDSEKVLSVEVYSDFIEFENIDWVMVPGGAVVV